jgi:hypothetical protein
MTSQGYDAGSVEEHLIARHFRPLATHPGALDLIDDAGVVDVPVGHDLVVKTDAIVASEAQRGRMVTSEAATRRSSMRRPEDPGSGLCALSFFITCAGRQLSRARRAELEWAQRLMPRRMTADKGRS